MQENICRPLKVVKACQLASNRLFPLWFVCVVELARMFKHFLTSIFRLSFIASRFFSISLVFHPFMCPLFFLSLFSSFAFSSFFIFLRLFPHIFIRSLLFLSVRTFCQFSSNESENRFGESPEM